MAIPIIRGAKADLIKPSETLISEGIQGELQSTAATPQPQANMSILQSISEATPESLAPVVGEASTQPVEMAALDPVQGVELSEPVFADLNAFEDNRFDVVDMKTRNINEGNPDTSVGFKRLDGSKIPPRIYNLNPNNSEVYSDAGIRSRSGTMVAHVNAGRLGINLSGLGTPAYQGKSNPDALTGPALSEEIQKYKEGDILAAISRSDAVIENEQGFKLPSPLYTGIASAVTENVMMNAFGGQTADTDALQEAMGESSLVPNLKDKVNPTVTHASGNKMLGQQIHLEYSRMQKKVLESQGVPTSDPRMVTLSSPTQIPTREAETLGAAFKHLWAETNPHMVTRGVDTVTKQITYALTPEGEAVLDLGSLERKKLFPRQIVRPAKTYSKIQGTDVQKNVARATSGAKKGQKMGKVLEEAMQNLGSVAHVVDKTRLKIILSTTLPSLTSGEFESFGAEINGIGQTKMDRFNASETQQKKKFKANPELRNTEDEYVPSENMAMLQDKLANEIRSMSQELDSANFLTWNIQGFQGRLTPQQSYFNPTTSKTVRFATRNAVPATIKPGNRQEKNIRQMYAMILIPKTVIKNVTGEETVVNEAGDSYLPAQRDYLLRQKEGELYSYGKRLEAALQMSDAEFESITTAIKNGVALDNPSFPKVTGLNLDPNNELDAKLIGLIRDNKDDGPLFIDTAIDFSKYVDFKNQYKSTKDKSLTFNSYVNAYIDGKTNGPASNAMQLGNSDTAFMTGVLRRSRVSNLDEGDMRDKLMDLASDSIDNGWEGLTSENYTPMNNVARQVFANRDLAKLVIMTYGYGKEIESFNANIDEVIELINERKIREEAEGMGVNTFAHDIALLEATVSRNELANMLTGRYAQSVEGVLGDETIEARSIMRSAAALHAAMNEPFIIKGPTGMDIHIGGESSTGYLNADLSTYRLSPMDSDVFQTTTVASYNTEPTAAAARTRGDQSIPGEHAYGGSVVAPIQAIDAATVAMTASGSSWDKLTRASKGSPYLHTIYDAFKMDANGYDVVLEEVNNNWMKATMDWSYLEQAKASLAEATERYNEKMKGRKPTDKITDNESAYMGWLLTVVVNPNTGKRSMVNMRNRLGKFTDLRNDDKYKTATREIESRFSKSMASVGFDVNNPPSEFTVAQLKQFKGTLSTVLNSDSRLNKMISETNNNKKKLKDMIMKTGYKLENGKRIVLQYFGH